MTHLVFTFFGFIALAVFSASGLLFQKSKAVNLRAQFVAQHFVSLLEIAKIRHLVFGVGFQRLADLIPSLLLILSSGVKLTSHKDFNLNMLSKLPSKHGAVVFNMMDDLDEQTDFAMTKSYQRFKLYSPQNNGFFVGLADFACLGWSLHDLAGYPYDDEHAALFSDWVSLGGDIEIAKNKIEKAKAA